MTTTTIQHIDKGIVAHGSFTRNKKHFHAFVVESPPGAPYRKRDKLQISSKQVDTDGTNKNALWVVVKKSTK